MSVPPIRPTKRLEIVYCTDNIFLDFVLFGVRKLVVALETLNQSPSLDPIEMNYAQSYRGHAFNTVGGWCDACMELYHPFF